MPALLYPPSRPQSIGEVLDSAFRIFQATLLKSLPFSVLATVAGQLQNIYAILTGRALRKFANDDPGWWALYALGVVLGCMFINAIMIRQAAIASGSQPSGVETLWAGLRKVPANIVMAAAFVVIVGLCFLPAAVIPRSHLTWVLTVLAIPATYVAVLFLCSWPALLLGHKGPLRSLAYSAHLVKGNWWRTVMVYLVMLTMIIVLSVTAGLVVGVLTQVVAARDLAVTTAVSAVMVVASGAVYMPFATSMSIALFGDLQARKEGTDLERRIAGAPASDV
jgi:hypothetical protein